MSQFFNWVSDLLSDHTLVGVLVGALSSVGTTVLVSRNNAAIQKANRQFEVKLASINTELEELVQLQEALQKWGRSFTLNARSLSHDQLFAENGNRLAKDEYSEQLRVGQAAVRLLSNRLGCEELREQISELLKHSIIESNNPEIIKVQMFSTVNELNECMEKIGSEIRAKRDARLELH